MKKISALTIVMIMLAGTVSAQKFYARIGAALSGGTSSNLDMLYKYTDDGTTKTIEVVPVDLGTGFTGSAAFGFMPSKYVGIELGISEFIGFPNFGDSIISMPGGMETTAKIKGGMLSVIPAVVITAGLDKVNPYARFGMLIGVLPTMLGTFEATQATNPATDIVVWKRYYGGIGLGYQAAGGVDFNIGKVVNFYVEAVFNGITWSPFYSEITKYTVNGVDQLPTLTTFEKETEYYAKYEIDNYVSPDVPKKELRKTYPFNNAGVSFGVKFKF
jgi:hypothetical protein